MKFCIGAFLHYEQKRGNAKNMKNHLKGASNDGSAIWAGNSPAQGRGPLADMLVNKISRQWCTFAVNLFF